MYNLHNGSAEYESKGINYSSVCFLREEQGVRKDMGLIYVAFLDIGVSPTERTYDSWNFIKN